MDTNFKQKVRERAYQIWMSAGRTDGMAHEHWVAAERAVANETGLPTEAKASMKKAASAKSTVSKMAPVKTAKVPATKTTAIKTTKVKH